MQNRRCYAAANTMEPDFTSVDPFRVIGVSREANKAEVKAQYYRLAKLYHPDVTNGDDEIFKRLKQVFNQFKKP